MVSIKVLSGELVWNIWGVEKIWCGISGVNKKDSSRRSKINKGRWGKGLYVMVWF